MKGIMDSFMSQQDSNIQIDSSLITPKHEKEKVYKKTQKLPSEILKLIVQKNLVDNEKRDILLEQSLLKGTFINKLYNDKVKDMHCEYLLDRHQRIVNEGLRKNSKNGHLGVEKTTKYVIGINRSNRIKSL